MHLGDLPSGISGRRLADGIWRATVPKAVLTAAAAVGSLAAALAHKLPGTPCAGPPACDWRMAATLACGGSPPAHWLQANVSAGWGLKSYSMLKLPIDLHY